MGTFLFFFLLNLLDLIVFMFRAVHSEPARGGQFARGELNFSRTTMMSDMRSIEVAILFSVMSARVRSGIKRCFESGSFSSRMDTLSFVS